MFSAIAANSCQVLELRIYHAKAMYPSMLICNLTGTPDILKDIEEVSKKLSPGEEGA
jgi:hypothetical protein